MAAAPKPVSSLSSLNAPAVTLSSLSSEPETHCQRPGRMRPGERRINRISIAGWLAEVVLRWRNIQTSTRSGRKGLTRSRPVSRRRARPSDAFEAIDRDHEDHRSTHLDFKRVGHEELARLHDRHHGAHGLGAGVALLANKGHDLFHFGFVDAEQDRSVGLLEKPARAVQQRSPVLRRKQGIDEAAGILVVDYRDDELHEPSIGRRTRPTRANPTLRPTRRP